MQKKKNVEGYIRRFQITSNINVCEDKFEFENPRRNPYILAVPQYASVNSSKIALNRAN